MPAEKPKNLDLVALRLITALDAIFIVDIFLLFFFYLANNVLLFLHPEGHVS